MIKETHDIIIDAREVKKWSQKKLAQKSEVSLRTITRIENGESVRDSNLEKVASALGLDWNQLGVESTKNKNSEKNYRLQKIVRGDELYELLYHYNLKTVYDYSLNIYGKDKMDLVIKFYRKSYEMQQALTGKHKEYHYSEKPKKIKVDFSFAPLIAEMHKQDLGIYAKKFTTVKRSEMTLKQFEDNLHFGNIFGRHNQQRDLESSETALLLFAGFSKSPKDKNSHITSIDPEYTTLSQDYILEKFNWSVDEIFADEESSFSVPSIKMVLRDSELYGFDQYLELKNKNNKEYYNGFWKSEYTTYITDQMYMGWIEDIQYKYAMDEKGQYVRNEKTFDIKSLDPKSIENGKKAAALFWNAWDIINKVAPHWNNPYLEFEKEEWGKAGKIYPDVSSKRWYGPENTIVKNFKRVTKNEVTEKTPTGDYFESEDGEIINIEEDDKGNKYVIDPYNDDEKGIIDDKITVLTRYLMTEKFEKELRKKFKDGVKKYEDDMKKKDDKKKGYK
jgi:transcriptional regulator with XRE-family HTH domain